MVPRHVPRPPAPMPQWIKSMLVPAATKEYLYERWLAGDIAPEAAPVDWGMFTDIADVIRHLTVKKPKSRSDIFPKQPLGELQQIGSEIAQRRTGLRLAISATDGIEVVFEGETLTLNEALKQERNLDIFAGQYKNAISRRKPSTETAKDVDPNLQVALETAVANSDEAYGTMIQEITTHPETSLPYRDRYLATLEILDKAETNAIDKGLVVPKTVAVTMGLPKRDLTAVPPTQPAKPVVATGDFGPQLSETRPQVVSEDRAEQARFARIKTGELKPGTVVPPEVIEEEAPPLPITGTDKPAVVTKAQVDTELTNRGLTDNAENRKLVRQELKAGKTAKPDTAWEAIFKTNYPQYNWMFTDLDRTKYGDVFDLFKFAKDGKMADEEFLRRFIGTSWYRELESSKKARELSAAIGNFTWNSGNLGKFLSKAMHYGYEGENLKQQAYKELFAKVGDKYVNDLALEGVRASTPYLALKRIGTQYFAPFADSKIEQALAGDVSTDDLLRQARLSAKAKYGHLSEQIDAGLTLEDLAESYKEKAARVLELDPKQINFDVDFSEALNWRRDGQPRVLSMSEWETELRTNDKYKYSFTKKANQDATDIGLSIARAFGKVG